MQMSNNLQNVDSYFNTKEAAQCLNLSPRTLERMRVSGGGPQFFKAGPGKRSRVLYARSDLVKWLEARCFDSTSEYETLGKL
ncbi:MAG: hypothetical protein DHS20C07_30080 [Methyloligella sp.]|jgi:hypothetical protein|nr:MAG: hypothetical protein DHS20C07_30080 [Methyloligella sp.]